jgi:excisionase family DNA binding protein
MKAVDDRRRLGSDELLSAAAAAAIAERSVRTIRRAYSSGRLAAYRDGGGRGIRIRRADLHDWLLRERVEPQTQGAGGSPPPHVSLERRPTRTLSENLSLLRAARVHSP